MEGILMPTTEENIAQLYMVGKNAIDRVLAKEVEIDNKVNNALSGLVRSGSGFVDTYMDLRDPFVTLQPRYTNEPAAEAFRFNTAEDYAPVGSFLDLACRTPGGTTEWANGSQPAPTQFNRKISIYACIAVGDKPHPEYYGLPESIARVSLLFNKFGPPHQWITTGAATPNYSEPRIVHETLHNFKFAGQSSGVTSYDDIVNLGELLPDPFDFGHSHLRLINLGTLPIHVKGLWVVKHMNEKVA